MNAKFCWHYVFVWSIVMDFNTKVLLDQHHENVSEETMLILIQPIAQPRSIDW